MKRRSNPKPAMPVYSLLFLILLTLTSTTVHAHSGHLPGETMHGLLHVEHIILILAIGLIVYSINVLRKK